jgi:signal transduction histidine kinase
MTPEQFLELGNLLPEPLFLVSGDGFVRAANRSALRILGADATQVAGQALAELAHNGKSRLMDYLLLCSGSKHPLAGSLSLKGPTGGIVALRCDGAVLHPAASAKDTLICLRCKPRQTSNSQFIALNRKIEELNREISARERTEEQIRGLNEELEQHIEARTAELKNACQDLESFAYTVSHDLRAPLRSIHGFSQALVEDCYSRLDDTGREFLRRICAAAARMDRLIDDLLEFSRVGRHRLRQATVSLSDICTDIVTQLRNEEPGRETSISIADNVLVTGDAHLLGIVMDNLLRNAWKFSGKVNCTRIAFGETERDGERVFFVRDNGAGFDMRYADKLFDAFQRLHSLDEFAGTGIGLASVRRIIERHGGRIWAESEEGKGATFYFTLGTAD